ncbi:uncharacterized protein LOC119105245, partial [Pollicipes pollicipes]|uniref:uncharacterized protein LOC119105245 n=1 Tax=Pollicipes pollicipes TaxID=41117 RepID=UPI001884F11F
MVMVDQTHGQNFFDRTTGFLHVLLRGPGIIEVRQQPIIVLKMGYVGEAEFFESDVLPRLMDLLGISPDQLRVPKVVREDSAPAGRRRRDAEAPAVQVEIEIGQPPANGTADTGNSTATLEDLERVQARVVDSFQTGQVDAALGVQVQTIAMIDPVPVATDPTGGVRATNETGDVDLSGVPGAKTFSETQREQEAEAAAAEAEVADGVAYQRPAELLIESQPVRGVIEELSQIMPLIKLHMKDTTGARMSSVGHESSPWQVEAELVSPPAGVSLLHAREPFRQGVATFSRLAVSGVASGLRLRFRVVQPAEVSFSADMSGSFSTTKKRLEARVASDTRTGTDMDQKGRPLRPAIRVFIRDPVTRGPAAAEVLRGYTWRFRADLYEAGSSPRAVLRGTRTRQLTPPDNGATFDPYVTFDDLTISENGFYHVLRITVTTADDASYRLVALSGPIHVRSAQAAPLAQPHNIGVRFLSDYSAVAGREEQFSAEVASWLQSRYGKTAWLRIRLSRGSIKANVDTRATSAADHDATVDQLQADLDAGLTMTDSAGRSYPLADTLLVDGVERKRQTDEAVLPVWAIAVMAALGALLLICLIFCFCHFYKNRDRK